MPKIKIMDPAAPARDGWHELYGDSVDALNGNISRIFLCKVPQTVPTNNCRQPDDWSCGPHAMAEALNQPNGEPARRWLLDHGYISSAYGTDYSGIVGYINTCGYECGYDYVNYDGVMQCRRFEELVAHLRAGYKAILCMHHPRTNYWTNGGHYICAYAIDGEEKKGSNFMFNVDQISAGSTGVDVLLLQEILKARGIYKGELDQSFGAGTKAALVSYQKSRGLTADGICGPKTWSDLLGKEQ